MNPEDDVIVDGYSDNLEGDGAQREGDLPGPPDPDPERTNEPLSYEEQVELELETEDLVDGKPGEPEALVDADGEDPAI